MGIFLSWLTISFIVAIIGKDRKIGYWGLFFCCLLLSPLFGLVIGMTSSRTKSLNDYELELLQQHTLMEKGLITTQEFEERKSVLQESINQIHLAKLKELENNNIASENASQMTKFYIVLTIVCLIAVLLIIIFKSGLVE